MHIEVGKSYKMYPDMEYPFGKRIHVVAIIEEQVMFRTWFKSKQRWEYQIEPLWHLDRLVRIGELCR